MKSDSNRIFFSQKTKMFSFYRKANTNEIDTVKICQNIHERTKRTHSNNFYKRILLMTYLFVEVMLSFVIALTLTKLICVVFLCVDLWEIELNI